MSGVICYRRQKTRMTGKFDKIVKVMYGLGMVALMKRQEAEVEVAEFKVLIGSEQEGQY